MGFNKLFKWILIITYITVCLLGVSYAGYSDNLRIVQNITTSGMEYSFHIDGGSMDIALEPEAASCLLGLNKGGTYELKYSVTQVNHSGNVSLKHVNHEYMGSITINLANASCLQNGTPVDITYFSSYIPNTLGSFDCYHDFNGMDGTITLVKTSEPFQLVTVIVDNEIPSEVQQQINLKQISTAVINPEMVKPEEVKAGEVKPEGVKPEEVKPEEIKTKENSKEESEKIKTDEVKTEGLKSEVINKEDSKVIKKVKTTKKVIMSIAIEATYDFKIPLSYNQFNYIN